MATKQKIKNFFKLEGFNLDSEALSRLYELFQKIDLKKHSDVFEKVLSSILQQNLKNNNITLNILEKACNISKSDNTNIKIFQVINILDMPELIYDIQMEKYVLLKSKKCKFISKFVSNSAKERMNLLLKRHRIVLNRLLKNKHFVIDDNKYDSNHTNLRSIMFLVSSGSKAQSVVVLGILGQFEGNWFLEDDGGTINLNIDKANYHKGLVLEGSVVLVEGVYDNKIFNVSTIGMPPLDSLTKSREALDTNFNYFGGLPLDESVKSNIKIDKLSHKELPGKSLVILSELWLDKDETHQKLKILFSGNCDLKPLAFILIGNLLSPITNNLSMTEKMNLLKSNVKKLVLNFASYPQLALKSHLILVPGPNDPFPGLFNILPRPPFLNEITQGITQSVNGYLDRDREELSKRIILASNPCRITVYNKEIVVFRENVANKLYRHCLHIPHNELNAETDEFHNDSKILNDSEVSDVSLMDQSQNKSISRKFSLEYHLIWSLLSQGHLLPVPLHVSPVGWNLDHTLSLFPVPDTVILADASSRSFVETINGCTFINPPSFSKVPEDRYPFKMLFPFSCEVEHCCVDV